MLPSRAWVLCIALAACASKVEPARPPERTTERAVENVRRDLSRSSLGLRQRVRADGLTAVEVQSGFRHATIVTRAPDGTKRTRCTDRAEDAERMLLGSDE